MTERVRHRMDCAVIVLLAIVAGGIAGWLASMPEALWPYTVLERRLVSRTVEPGGELSMQRRIDYHEVECWRQYARRAVSQVRDGPKAGYVARFPPVVEDRLPVDLSNKWQTWSEHLPPNFPCGPAYLVETITAACTWWQRNVSLLRKPDVITPFEVVNCTGAAE